MTNFLHSHKPDYLFTFPSRSFLLWLVDMARRGLIALCETPRGWHVWICAEVRT